MFSKNKDEYDDLDVDKIVGSGTKNFGSGGSSSSATGEQPKRRRPGWSSSSSPPSPWGDWGTLHWTSVQLSPYEAPPSTDHSSTSTRGTPVTLSREQNKSGVSEELLRETKDASESGFRKAAAKTAVPPKGELFGSSTTEWSAGQQEKGARSWTSGGTGLYGRVFFKHAQNFWNCTSVFEDHVLLSW